MKIYLTLFSILFCFYTGIAQTSAKPAKIITTPTQSTQNNEVKQTVPEEVLSFRENEYNFGKIPQGKPVTHVFLFTNTGKTPVSLENVQASCGCTTPAWSKDTVKSGETSKITVGYNAANEGVFTKSITITYTGNQSKQINIKGEVWKTPITSAPENSALGNLNNQQ